TSLGASAASGGAAITVASVATLTSIAVTPSTPTIAINGTVQMAATGAYSDGSHADLTSAVTWTTSSASDASVSSAGLVLGVSAGAAIITAQLGVTTGFSPVIVIAPAPNKYARLMTALLPPGRLWRLVGGSLLTTVIAGCADELGRLDARTADLLSEDDPTTAVELLPEYERELDIESTGTNAERQARVVSRLIARQRYRPVDIQNALALLLAEPATSVVIVERTHAFASSIGDDRAIFRFLVYRDPTLPGTYFLASAQELLNKIKPSHTAGVVIESINALYDDPHSLYDRDIRGA
ncbi:MAG TPA: putative phage tail protein, partial [Kofleriaceae bacterium]